MKDGRREFGLREEEREWRMKRGRGKHKGKNGERDGQYGEMTTTTNWLWLWKRRRERGGGGGSRMEDSLCGRDRQSFAATVLLINGPDYVSRCYETYRHHFISDGGRWKGRDMWVVYALSPAFIREKEESTSLVWRGTRLPLTGEERSPSLSEQSVPSPIIGETNPHDYGVPVVIGGSMHTQHTIRQEIMQWERTERRTHHCPARLQMERRRLQWEISDTALGNRLFGRSHHALITLTAPRTTPRLSHLPPPFSLRSHCWDGRSPYRSSLRLP